MQTDEALLKSLLEAYQIIQVKLKDIFKDHPDAWKFTTLYGEYIHAIDDMIDNNTWNPESLLKITRLAIDVYSCDFYRVNAQHLAPIAKSNNNCYADVVKWEKEPDGSLLFEAASHLRHCGYEMFLAVVELVAGYDKMREMSSEFRSYAHYKHSMD